MTEDNTADGHGAQGIPVDRWGRDHWSTFAYVCSCLFNRCELDTRRMRTDPVLHPGLGGVEPVFGRIVDGSVYPTRLRDGETASPHDDWSCLDDAEAAGLLANGGTGLHRAYRLTERGLAVHAELLAHLNDGGKVSAFALGGAA